jgi:uncharacterized membrane protein
MRKTLIGIFEAKEDAEGAISKLRHHDFDPKDISIVMKDRSVATHVADDTGVQVANGAATGVATGAIIGGLAGLLSTTILPELGAFFIGGPIAAALGLTGAAALGVSGAATGAAAGGLVGALTGLGLSHDEATIYEDRIKEGAILLAVPVGSNDEKEARIIMEDYDATDVKVIVNDAQKEDPDYKRHSHMSFAR